MERAPLDLLSLALSRPREALSRARVALADGLEPFEASVAHHAAGIVLRDFGDVNAGIRELRAALRYARASGSVERVADVQATLGVALVFAGRTAAGMASFDDAAAHASGVLAGRVRMRRGAILRVLGRHREALNELGAAVSLLRAAGEGIWEARALANRGLVYLALGATDRADADVARAEELYADANQEWESADVRHHRALVAFRSGDLPAALAHLDSAARRFEALDATMEDVSVDRCTVLLAAGLPQDAVREAKAAIERLERGGGQVAMKADLLLAAAEAALAAEDVPAALEQAQAAHRYFQAQRRAWSRAHAELLLLEARRCAGLAADAISPSLLHRARRTAATMDSLGSGEAPRAHLLAGRIALELGRVADADRHLAAAARARRRGPALSRAVGWLAQALCAEATGDARRVLHACGRGLDVLDEHRLTFGASELRAQATARGAELAALAQRQALATGGARRLLVWSERWRATALAVPPVRPLDDDELQADLTAVRDIVSRIESGRARGVPTAGLAREQQKLETAIRARLLRTRGADPTGGPVRGGLDGTRFDVDALLAELAAAGDTRLLQIVEVDGRLYVLVCGSGQVRRFPAGAAGDAAREVDFARFGLHRLAYGIARNPHLQLELMDAAGRKLEELLLGPAAGHLGDGPVVVVPPGRLHAVPWTLLPSLRHRVLSVAPSASMWLRARAAAPPPRDDVVLVVGPDLGTGGAEVPQLAAAYPDPTVLAGGGATVEAVLKTIDGAGLAHIAAHGRFRADSPLFSSLQMDDGPLTVHDLERLRRAPYRLILSSCDSGLAAPAGADELLGLTSSVVPLGTVGVIAAVVPVNDEAAVPLMLGLHRRLHSGATFAEALAGARQDLDDDPVRTATGWSFVALGGR